MRDELGLMEYEDLEDLEVFEDEELEDMEWEDMEDMEDLEALDEFEDLQIAGPRRRGGGTLTFPPTVIRVRPAATLSRFRFRQSALLPHHIRQIRSLARVIVGSWRTRRPIRTVRLVGHTDSRGGASFNQHLGMQRAQSVQRRLMVEINRLRPGLARRIRFVPQSLGERRPVASNRTADGQARNRRVQVFFMRGSRTSPPRRGGTRSCGQRCELIRRTCVGSPLNCLRRHRQCLRNCRGVPV